MRISVISLAGAAALLPLVAAAQQPAALHAPVPYIIGAQTASLYPSLRDTLRRSDRTLPARSPVEVVGKYQSRWVVVKRNGFTYFMRASLLDHYDPADLDPLPLNANTQLITYEGVMQVPGASQAELFARATAWLKRAYTLQNVHIERRDSVAGKLVVRGERPVAVPVEHEGVLRQTYAGVVRHTLSITVKDGRYKYVFNNLTHDALQTPHMQSGGPLEQERASLFGYAGIGSRTSWLTLKTQATHDVRALANSLVNSMSGQPAATRQSDDDF